MTSDQVFATVEHWLTHHVHNGTWDAPETIKDEDERIMYKGYTSRHPYPTDLDQFRYQRWLNAVDVYLLKKLGITHDDLPDGLSYDAYHDGVSPTEYADELLADEGYEDDDDWDD